MDRPPTRHLPYCRCTRCGRDRLVLSALSPRIARVLRLAIVSR